MYMFMGLLARVFEAHSRVLFTGQRHGDVTHVGYNQIISSTFKGMTLIPSLDTINPNKQPTFTQKMHF